MNFLMNIDQKKCLCTRIDIFSTWVTKDRCQSWFPVEVKANAQSSRKRSRVNMAIVEIHAHTDAVRHAVVQCMAVWPDKDIWREKSALGKNKLPVILCQVHVSGIARRVYVRNAEGKVESQHPYLPEALSQTHCLRRSTAKTRRDVCLLGHVYRWSSANTITFVDDMYCKSMQFYR